MKMGQIGNFLSNSTLVLCDLLPRFIPKEKSYDVKLLASVDYIVFDLFTV